MKKTSLLLPAFLVIMAAVSLTGCVDTEKLPLSYSENEDGTLTVSGRGRSTAKEIVIPAEYNGKAVTGIADFAFKGTDIVSLTVGSNITHIGTGIVSRCDKLLSLSVPFLGAYKGDSANAYVGYLFDTAKGKTASRSLISFTLASAPRLEADALCGLRALEFFTLPSDTLYIGARCFEGCSKLTSLTGLSQNIAYIGYHAFNTTKLSKLDLSVPSSALQDDCLYGIEGLSELSVDLSGIASGNKALVYLFDSRLARDYFDAVPNPTFAGTQSILPQTLTKITLTGPSVAEYALCGAKITDMALADSVTSIGPAAFAACSNITAVKLPDGVLTVGDYAFIHCARLESVVFGSKLETIGTAAFSYCQKLSDVDFSQCMALTKLMPQAFQNCTAIKELELPASLKRLETGCFQGVKSLTSVTIPAAVNYIGVNAFDQCTGLSSVTFVQKTGWQTVNGYMKPDLSKPQNNAQYLTQTYVTYSWSR